MQQFRRSRTHGFTLIELMVVIVILGLLVGIVGPNVMRYLVKGRRSTAKTQMAQFEQAIDSFRLDKRRLPDSLADLVSADGSGYLPGKEVPKDPWGNEYRYERLDKKNFDIVCLGGDGQEGGDDLEDRDIRREDIRKDDEENP